MDLMELRRKLLLRNRFSPPIGYKWIEYAEKTSSGNHYIDLPYGFDETDYVEVKGSVYNVSGAEGWLVGPDTWNDNNNRFGFLGCSFGKFTFCFGEQGSPNTLLQPEMTADSNIHIAVYSNRLFSLETNSTMDVSNKLFGGATKPLRLFFGYNNGATGRIYYFKQVKQNGDEIYIRPIKNILTGDVEMYDMISKTIMPKTGTLVAPQ